MKQPTTPFRKLFYFMLLCSLFLSCSSQKETTLFFNSIDEAEAFQLELGVQRMSDSAPFRSFFDCEIMCFIGVRDGFGYFSKFDSIPILTPPIFCSTVWMTVPSDSVYPGFEGANTSFGREEAIEKFKEIRSLLNAKFGSPFSTLNGVDYEDENAIIIGEDQIFSEITWYLKKEEEQLWSITLTFMKERDEAYFVGFGSQRLL